MPVSQREKKLRGEAFENIVTDELEGFGCEIYQRFRGGESSEHRPYIYAMCDGRMKRIEVKLTQAWEKEGDRVRSGRSGHNRMTQADLSSRVSIMTSCVRRTRLTVPDRSRMLAAWPQTRYPQPSI